MANPDYFTLAELRDLPDCSGAAFADAQIEAAAAHFTAIVEREIGYPLIPRTFTDRIDGESRYALVLTQGWVTALTSITVDGVAVADLADVLFDDGVLRYTSRSTWSGANPGNVVVTYTAGRYATCPGDVKNATLWATRDRLLGQSDQAGIDVRRTSVTTDYGTTNYVLPGENRPTGFPELDAVIASYVRTSTSLGFA